MLTLNTGSVCDVCSEDYSSRLLPHSIPCGHVFCQHCCKKIIEKTSPRLSPSCPFCREPFESDSIRLIRIDFSPSRWQTPKVKTVPLDIPDDNDPSNADDRILLKPTNRSREEARRLEHKVATVAHKKCSVEEVSTLHKEVTQWLMSDVKPDDKLSSLSLSAALLRAILTNHLAHSDAIRVAKSVEHDLQSKLEDAEITIGKLEAELRRQKALHAQKVQECHSLAAEMTRLKLIHTTLGPPARGASPTQDSRVFPTSTSPTPPANAGTTYGSTSPSPLSRTYSNHSTTSTASASAHHTRSLSMSSRPTTPAVPSRANTQTPSPSSIPRSHTPSIRPQPPPRSQTPAARSAASIFRPETPAPPLPMPPSHLAAHFSSPPSHYPESRRMSQTPAPRLSARSTSSEDRDREYYPSRLHQRWIPPPDPDQPPSASSYAHGLARPASAAPGSRGISSAAAQAQASR